MAILGTGILNNYHMICDVWMCVYTNLSSAICHVILPHSIPKPFICFYMPTYNAYVSLCSPYITLYNLLESLWKSARPLSQGRILGLT